MADTLDITIEAGATWWYQLALTNDDGSVINLTGYTAAMWLKRTKRDTTTDLQINSGDEITIDGPAGTLTIEVPDDITALLNGEYVYDLIMTAPNGFVTRLLEGKVTIDTQVTLA